MNNHHRSGAATEDTMSEPRTADAPKIGDSVWAFGSNAVGIVTDPTDPVFEGRDMSRPDEVDPNALLVVFPAAGRCYWLAPEGLEVRIEEMGQ